MSLSHHSFEWFIYFYVLFSCFSCCMFLTYITQLFSIVYIFLCCLFFVCLLYVSYLWIGICIGIVFQTLILFLYWYWYWWKCTRNLEEATNGYSKVDLKFVDLSISQKHPCKFLHWNIWSLYVGMYGFLTMFPSST